MGPKSASDADSRRPRGELDLQRRPPFSRPVSPPLPKMVKLTPEVSRLLPLCRKARGWQDGWMRSRSVSSTDFVLSSLAWSARSGVQLVSRAPSHMNPLKERELEFRGTCQAQSSSTSPGRHRRLSSTERARPTSTPTGPHLTLVSAPSARSRLLLLLQDWPSL